MLQASHPPIILASASTARRRLLEAAGLAFQPVPADVDEPALRRTLEEHDVHGGPERVAGVLARAKAEEVSRRFPEALVIGADQVLALGRDVLSKPADLSAARDQLRRLAGRSHKLHSALSLARGGSEQWRDIASASLSVRQLSSDFIDAYVAHAGERICASVGAYELEGLGVHLFERIDGDYFTILGLPLLPLLAELRRRKVIAE